MNHTPTTAPTSRPTTRSASRDQQIVDFYTRREGGPSLFEIWERGDAAGDSVTPSTYSPSYRLHMRDLILGLRTGPAPLSVLSLGCGNAAVEQLLLHAGCEVLATDLCEEAVALAKQKGLNAVRADLITYTPERAFDVVYMDGLLGHLHDDRTQLLHVFERVLPWLTSEGVVVASNDAPPSGRDVEAAPGVVDFVWLSTRLMQSQAEQAGFGSVSAHTFDYDRPLSGARQRSIVVAGVQQPR